MCIYKYTIHARVQLCTLLRLGVPCFLASHLMGSNARKRASPGERLMFELNVKQGGFMCCREA